MRPFLFASNVQCGSSVKNIETLPILATACGEQRKAREKMSTNHQSWISLVEHVAKAPHQLAALEFVKQEPYTKTLINAHCDKARTDMSNRRMNAKTRRARVLA